MPRLTINGVVVEAPPGATLLEAAWQAGIEVPTLCHTPGVRAQTSCMICVVEEMRTGRTLPACAAKAEEGMVIATNSPEIRAARREVLQLLLSEHAGDCEAPCRRMCPASMDIPLMLRRIAAGDMDAAARIAAAELALPATLGWICNAPCEVGCRRGVHDEAIAIRELHRIVSEAALARGALLLPCAPDSGKRVAVIGGGLAGLAAAFVLRRNGHACHVFEKREKPGGSLRELPEDRLPTAILDAELGVLRRMGVEFRCNSEEGAAISPAALRAQFDAVVVACASVSADEPGMFPAEEHAMAVRAVASGKKGAEAAHYFLNPAHPSLPKPYDSSLGRVGRDQIAQYVVNRVDPAVLNRSRQTYDPAREAERCFHCDCHAPVSCKLRRYATEYGAQGQVFRKAERPPTGSIQGHESVIFEPGKCIRCGICVEITRDAGEGLGLTFVGRGFNILVKTPFNESFEAALSKCAQACVKACPTGALVFAKQEERMP